MGHSARLAHVGEHEIFQSDWLHAPSRVEDRLLVRTRKVLCLSVWLSSMTSWFDGKERGRDVAPTGGGALPAGR